ncbi:HNH endonuclease [Nostoc sp. 2RC]|uniref:HNH endonuclease n=1 Tax=Nostoc sp. 2RC TaxID=2485484 RepID=UPI001623C867|nr:HNH endonuclease [Nostoc sp. 2RC]MBC1238092.1 HNH endonuclease [Nostoc sp. 2RC]
MARQLSLLDTTKTSHLTLVHTDSTPHVLTEKTLPTVDDGDQEIRDIPGYEGRYFASRDGKIWSSWRGSIKPLKSFTPYDGKHTVILYNGSVRCTLCVDRLVALTFIGECPYTHKLTHVNGDRSDNRASNLKYVTKGRANKRSNSAISSQDTTELTDKEVRVIRELLRDGKLTQERIAEIYGVSRQMIQVISASIQ